MSDERTENHRSSNRINNMPNERTENHRSSNRVDNMSDERNENHRSSNRVENMSAQRIQNQNNQNRSRFKEIRQWWDFDHPCSNCGKVWLENAPAGTRSLSCGNVME